MKLSDLQCPVCGSTELKDLGYKTPENGGTIFVAEELGRDIECYALVNQIECPNDHGFYMSMDEKA